MSADCLFCKIAQGELSADKVYEDDLVIAIKDINPQAPIHLLVIPVKPLVGIQGAEDEDRDLLGHLMLTARHMAAKEGLGSGYRLVINAGPEGGQEVPHLHVHVLGGRQMNWPPG